MSDGGQTISVADMRALHAYLDERSCECGGPLTILTDIPADKEGKQLTLELSCILCGLPDELKVTFTGPEFTEDSLNSTPGRLPEPRKHHYLFGHIAIPQFFLGDPDQFINAFPCSDLGNGQLLRLWSRVGQDSGQPLPSGGLHIRLETVAGTPCPVIVMPETKGSAEVAFAALYRRDLEDNATARYFVLERTQVTENPEPFGVICEWFGDRSRKNHERFCKTDLTSYIETLEQLIEDEVQLGSEGRVGLGSWRPDTDTPRGLSLDREGYRPSLCRLAFETLPKCLTEGIDTFVQAAEASDAPAALVTALEMHLPKEDECREALTLFAQEARVHEVRIEAWRLLLITMPKPLSAPEPQFIAAVFDRNAESLATAYKCMAIYTSEVAIPGGRVSRLLCRIDDDNHGIISDIEGNSRKGFCNAVAMHLSGTPAHCSSNVLEHLVLYASIHRRQ